MLVILSVLLCMYLQVTVIIQKSQCLPREKNNYRIGEYYYCYYRGGGNMALKNSGRTFLLLEEIKSSK